MTPSVTNFQFNSFAIRAVEINGKPGFIASDICKVLGYVNTSGALKKHVDAVDKYTVSVGLRGKAPICINEAGLYALIMRSDKAEAKAFRTWVTSDVLPAIRKDGAYVMGEEKVVTGEMSEDELILRGMTALQRKVERVEEEKRRVEKENKRLEADLETERLVSTEVTWATWKALRGLYLTQQQFSAVHEVVKRIHAERALGIVRKETRFLPRQNRTTEISVYHAHVLDEAYARYVAA